MSSGQVVNPRYVTLAEEWVGHVREAGFACGALPVVIDGLALDVVDLLGDRIVSGAALRLRSLDEGAVIGQRRGWGSAVLEERGAAAGKMSIGVPRLTAWLASHPNWRGQASPADVVLVPHGGHVLAALMPLVPALRELGLRATAAAPSVGNVEAFDLWPGVAVDRIEPLAGPSVARRLVYVTRIVRATRLALATASAVPLAGEHRLFDHAVVRRRLERHMTLAVLLGACRLISTSVGMRELLLRRRARVVVISDAVGVEGRAALAVASQLGARTVAVACETRMADEERWVSSPSDLICVRSDAARRALRASGAGADRVVVTGTPYLRPVPSSTGAQPSGVRPTSLAETIVGLAQKPGPVIRSSVAKRGRDIPDVDVAGGFGEAPTASSPPF